PPSRVRPPNAASIICPPARPVSRPGRGVGPLRGTHSTRNHHLARAAIWCVDGTVSFVQREQFVALKLITHLGTHGSGPPDGVTAEAHARVAGIARFDTRCDMRGTKTAFSGEQVVEVPAAACGARGWSRER